MRSMFASMPHSVGNNIKTYGKKNIKCKNKKRMYPMSK